MNVRALERHLLSLCLNYNQLNKANRIEAVSLLINAADICLEQLRNDLHESDATTNRRKAKGRKQDLIPSHRYHLYAWPLQKNPKSRNIRVIIRYLSADDKKLWRNKMSIMEEFYGQLSQSAFVDTSEDFSTDWCSRSKSWYAVQKNKQSDSPSQLPLIA
jgi:hypothetical protein